MLSGDGARYAGRTMHDPRSGTGVHQAGIRGACALLVAAMACACAPMPSGGDVGDAPRELPGGAPSIRGQVTAREALDRIRIEADPGAASGSDKAVVTLTLASRVLHRDGRAASTNDLTVGCTVSAWFTGPVRESYPVQAEAATVVIEPTP